MRLCAGVTTRFHRVTKLVSGHTVSSWMGGKRNRGGGRRRDGEGKSGGRRSWDEREKESEGEEEEKSLVNDGLRRGRLNRHFVSKEKDTWLYRVQRSWKRIEKARARLMFSYFRWRTCFRDTERCIQTMKHSCSMLWRKNAGWKRRTVKIKLWKWRIFREPKLDALILINILRSHTFLIIKNYRVIF